MRQTIKYMDDVNEGDWYEYQYEYPDTLDLLKIFPEVKDTIAEKEQSNEMTTYLQRIKSLVADNGHADNTMNFGQKILRAKAVSILNLFDFEGIKQKGQKNWVCCPFHREDKASMIIDQKNRYHCFGCGADGTSIDFVMNIKGLNFNQAVNFLVGGVI